MSKIKTNLKVHRDWWSSPLLLVICAQQFNLGTQLTLLHASHALDSALKWPFIHIHYQKSLVRRLLTRVILHKKKVEPDDSGKEVLTSKQWHFHSLCTLPCPSCRLPEHH